MRSLESLKEILELRNDTVCVCTVSNYTSMDNTEVQMFKLNVPLQYMY